MFQQHLKLLRNEMKKRKITHYYHEISDPHMTEFTHSFYHRLEWLCGFSGFTGEIVITQKQACLWTDSIYFLQAKKEIAQGWEVYDIDNIETISPCLMIKQSKKISLGLNPEITNYMSLEELFDIELDIIPIDIFNIINPLPFILSPIHLFNECSTPVIQKIESIRKKYHNSTIILTDLADVNWAFNIRAHDIPFSPIAYGYGVITPTQVHLFVGNKNQAQELEVQYPFNELKIKIHSYHSFFGSIKHLIKTPIVVYNKENVNMKLQDIIDSISNLKRKESLRFIQELRSIRSSKEIEMIKQIHINDSVILCYFFSKLNQLKGTDITEWDASVLLEKLRKELGEKYDEPSFLSIIATGKNGAMMHYEPTEQKNELINWDKTLLCDVGAQYKSGCTTDVTRTLHFGTPTQKERLCYTRVLQGHIDAQMTKILQDESIDKIDTVSRKLILNENEEWDFKHDIGHGVGHYSFVHEYPPMYGVGLKVKEGMTTSIEPGIYLEKEFGIRIENVIVFENTQNSSFKLTPLTLVPYCSCLIDYDLLTIEEKNWLKEYYQNIRTIIIPRIKDSYVIQWVESNLILE
ncbi:aminopeptidase, putative [Entamoeba histolytica HM-1:IMSS-B]|uniref:Aminopeptidase n=4 Tax=Entamoeba histolytica TaxID=5759 RepID=C4M3N5_ENTH1|nr:hypothetical protein, conserved [Entamoeba histolytica HM-1:IMSS]EAL48822.2 hypothetical protein, conserved [Entamoeba histolytica HM-1:IMSS]EMH74462.1 aminopeptidase, putative [Entamoeba histolytica HM-1:IMSS-B]ENY65197.1 xaa-pro aminopeptidase, putative [Entamoeba histolytica HM-1:IMSS-A]GAT95937.1 hypothetical protein conserved [Entamoeba histolytica]|eukprot:XP_654211.2 hypothetical protein, conserved [Entamoeba histolytica HM-1:IMSS]